LQRKDDGIRLLERKAESIPTQIESIKAKTEADRKAIEDLKSQRETASKARRKCESDAEDLSSKIHSLEQRVFQVKTNKEYQAILKEIEESKKEISRKENEAIALMEDEEKAGELILLAEREMEEKTRDAERRIAEFEKVLRETEQMLVTARREREVLFQALGRGLRERYQKIAAAENGKAVVPVRKGACGGCFSALPPQTVNEIKKNDRIITCEVCSRILVWDEAQGQ